jgi:large repetitive protein
VGIQGRGASAVVGASQNQNQTFFGLINKAKWLAGASVLAASTSALAAPPLILNNVGLPTQVGSGQGKRGMWANGGTVNGQAVDIVVILTKATLNHSLESWDGANNFSNGQPVINSVGADNVELEWRIYKAGTYNVTTNTGGVLVAADVHVQFNDVDGPSNERVFLPVCSGNIKWIRIDADATTGRAFGTVNSQPKTFSLIGDKNYNSQPESGVEVFYPDTSIFKMGRTGNSGFRLRMGNPTYTAFDTLDYECADFVPPVAVNDSKEGVSGTPTIVNILNNDSNATQNNNAPNNNTLAPSEYAKTSVSLTAPTGATGIVTDVKGRVTGFTVRGEGVWAYDPATGELRFTPEASFKGYATNIDYTFTNALGIASNVATVTIWYPAIGVTKTSTFNDTNSDTYGQVGETIDYIYLVKAYGAEALQNVSITETGFTGAGTLPVPAYLSGDTNTDNKLDLNETWSFKATYALVAADLTSGSVTNSASGTGKTAAVTTVTDTSDSSNPGDGNGTGTSGPGPNNGDPTRTTLPKAPIAASNDSQTGTIFVGAGASNAYNVLGNDTLKAAAATPAAVTITVETPATNAGVTLDPATGLVSVAPGVPAGSYSIGYKICEIGNPTNCATATASIVVTAAMAITATVDAPSPVTRTTGGSDIINALTNDRLNGVVVAIGDVNLTIETPASNAGVTLDPATGLVSVAPGTPIGTYTIDYKICEKTNPTNCATSTVTVVVNSNPITAANDSVPAVNGATGNPTAFNAFANDILNGAPVVATDLNTTVTAPATPKSPGAPVPTLDPATGIVAVPPGTPAGSYTIGYEICEKADPTNCKTATITVAVAAAAIAASNDAAGPVTTAAGGSDLVNALTNDTLNSAPVVIANINLSVLTPASNAGVTLDTATGLVSVAPGTPSGSYTIGYNICEKLNPTNCAMANVVVQVDPTLITATVDTPSPVNGANGGNDIINAFTNDRLNGIAIVLAEINATVTSPAVPVTPGASVPVLDASTGLVDVPAGTPAGTYTIGYQICEKANPANCAPASITVIVTAAPITAANDTKAGVNGVAGDLAALNLFDGDTLNGVAATPGNTNLSVATGSSLPSQLTFNTATGVVGVKPGTPAGTYSFDYQICEKLNPTNCKTATASVTVDPAPIVASNDSASGINGATGATAVTNAFTSDTVNGVAASPSNATLSVKAGTTVPSGLTFNPATGSVNVVPGTPAGSYVINYTICEALNPTNCKDAMITVDVVAAPVAALNDSATGLNGATGVPLALNVLTGDTINGMPATLTNATLSVATGSSVPPQLTFDPGTGIIGVKPGTPAGTYSFDYQICETLNPTNCKTAAASVTVDPSPIVATNDSASGINGTTGATDVINAFTSDTVNGVAASPTNATVSVKAGTTVPTGLTFNPATGSVDVVPGTPAGSYVINYTICETLNPTNCKEAKITVDVVAAPIAATPDTPPAVNGAAGNPSITNAFTNDRLNGAPVDPALITATMKTPASNPGVVLDPTTGNVSVASGTPAGTYTITYEICEKLNPTNCATSTVTVVVDAAPIAAPNDNAGPINGSSGGNNVVNALTNDTLNGAPATIDKIDIIVTSPASNPGVVLDPATGNVNVAPGTPAGTYSIGYQICEELNPTNCASGTVMVVVTAPPIAATADAPPAVNGLSGNPAIVNAFANDTLNGTPVDPTKITATVMTPASNPGVALNLATGNVSVAAGTPAGIYTIAYQICETLNPTNCANSIVTIIVEAAPIAAINDTTTPVTTATGGTNLVDALLNDTLNGIPVVLANVNLTVTAPASNAGVTLDPATGLVSVAPGTPAGNYTIGYQICEKLNPTNCATATVAVVVNATPIGASNDTPASINGVNGNPNAINAFANDTLNGAPVDPAAINTTILTPASNPGVVMDPVTGTVSVASGTPAGTYTVEYQICEKLNPTNCKTATVTVVVEAAPIAATPDAPAPVNGSIGGDDIINALTNDTLNGAPVVLSAVNVTVTAPATPVVAGKPVPVLDPASGLVDVPAGTPSGTYTIGYQICEKLNPTNCANAVVSVVVTASPIAATPDAAPAVNGGTGNPSVTNAFTNDSLNGVPVDPALITATVKTPASNPSVVLDPATGNVSVAPGTPAGTYTITYEICEKLNPTNCATSTVTVIVDAAPIAATPDTPPAVNGGTGNPSITNAFTHDILNGVPVVPSLITATVKTPASNPGVVLDPATGTVSVAPGTPAGTYTITYEICEKLNPTNCATSTVTVVVDAAPIAATNDDAGSVPGIAGGPNLVNALVNDSLNGQPVDIAKVTLTVTAPALNPGVTLDQATGLVSVAPNTPAGTYSIGYQICETLNPTNCATATVAVIVQAAAIAATPDTPVPVNGAIGANDIINAFTNDVLSGVPVVPAKITATVTAPATSATPGAPVPVLDPATGFVDVPTGTPAGTYTIAYQFCETLNPTNCANTSVTVVVQPPAITASADAPGPVRQGIGNPNAINAFANDMLNGVPIDPATIVTTVLTPASNPGVVLDPATGNVSVGADVPSGTYTITYQICERLNPSNCATSTVTVVVELPISAVEGTVFTDMDGDKVIDPNDPRRAGWIVEIMLGGAIVGTARTNDQGNYRIEGLTSGPGYDIVFRNPENNVVYDRINGVTLGANTTVIDQNQPIDPSGIFYDSITRQPIAGVNARLADANGLPLPAICFVDRSQANQTTGASGEYRFDIVPGAAPQCPVAETIYRIVATPPAGFAPSSSVLLPLPGPFDPTGLTAPVRINPAPTPPTGNNPPYYLSFRLAAGDPDVIFNHIALDPFLTRTPLIVTKTSIKRSASVGDVVPYEITVRNTENAQRAGVIVVDILPPGMKYVIGTASVNGAPAEPVKTDRQLSWTGQIIPASGSVRYNLTLVVGAGVTGGEKVNTGLAQNGTDGSAISNRGTAVVSIIPSAIFDCSELLGKVFEDTNRNGYQDEGEPGVPGVRLATVNGQLITTDEFGRYHIACAAVPDARIGSNFVLKVDTRTLPLGWDTTTDNPRSIRLTRGKFGELNFGVASKEPSSTRPGDTPTTRKEKGE